MDVKTIAACCEPVLAGALDEAEATDLAAAFKVLADPVRLRLLSLVAAASAGEACACDLVEPGKWAWCRVVPERLAVLRDALAVPVAA